MNEQTPYGISDKKRKIAQIEFVENPEPRCACVLVLDCSSSMDPRNYEQEFGVDAPINIELLNNGVKELKRQLEKDDIASKRVEIAVVKFDTTAEVVNDFTTVEGFTPPELNADGVTLMTDAIELAANMIEERKKDYKQNGISYYRPWMFLITDGCPTDERGYPLKGSDPRLAKAIKIIHNGVNSKQFTFFAVGVDNADMQTLSKLSPKFPPKKLRENKWSEMFQWLSSSLVSLSSSSMDTEKVKLPPSNWDEVEI